MKKLLTKTNILLFLIICLAAFMRLYRISDYMTFLGDEGRDVLIVKTILEGHLKLLGPRSSAADFYYGPIYYYFITPFLWLFNYDPVGPAVFVALVGIATVYLIFFVGNKFFGKVAGLVAALLYAISPLVIAYSRSSWNPNPLPFVSLLIIYFLYKAVKSKSWKLLLLIGILFGIAIQLQYIVVFLGIIIFLFILFGRIFLDRAFFAYRLINNYLLVLIGFIVGWSPFLAFEILHGFRNLKVIFRLVFFGEGGPVDKITNIPFLITVYDVFYRLFARLVTNFPPPEQISVNTNPYLLIWQLGTLLLAIISIIALFRIKNKFILLLFSLWLFIGIGLFGFYKRLIYDYYFGFLFPLPFLLVGNMLSQLYVRLPVKYLGKILTVLIFVVLFILNLSGMPFLSTPNKQKAQMQEISNFVLQKAGGQEFNFALLTLGNSDFAYRYFFHVAKYDPATILPPDQDPQRKSVAQQLLIVCEDPNCHPLGNSLWEVAGFGRAEIAGEWNVSVVKVFKLIHYKGKN